MKLRCTRNSIRLRLKKSDLQKLTERHAVSERVELPDGGHFGFSLTVLDEVHSRVKWVESELKVFVSREEAEAWADTSRVGLEFREPLEGDEKLHLLIEKDFPCTDRPGEDKADYFGELASEQKKNC